MKTTICVCDQPATTGFLCHRCILRMREMIRSTPEWADQLDIVRMRLVKYTAGNQGRRNRETPLPYNPAGSNQAREIDQHLRRMTADLNAPDFIITGRLALVALWLSLHISEIALQPTSQQWFTKLGDHLQATHRLVDRPVERWYAGRCPCGEDLYPNTTDVLVQCPSCSHTWTTEHRRTELLRQVRDLVVPGPDIARALSNLGTTPLTPERLRKWRHLGKLKVREFNPGPPPTNSYRVGDVLDLIAKEIARTQPHKEDPT